VHRPPFITPDRSSCLAREVPAGASPAPRRPRSEITLEPADLLLCLSHLASPADPSALAGRLQRALTCSGRRLCSALDIRQSTMSGVVQWEFTAPCIGNFLALLARAEIPQLLRCIDGLQTAARNGSDTGSPLLPRACAALPADVENASHCITRRVLRNWRSSPPSRRRAPWVRKDDLRSIRARNKHQARGRSSHWRRSYPASGGGLPCSRSAIVSSVSCSHRWGSWVALPEAPLMKASRRGLCAQQVQPTLEHRPIEAVAADSPVRLVLAGESLRQSRLRGN
jgi:hypothetical protein